jgi:hypothetical protein
MPRYKIYVNKITTDVGYVEIEADSKKAAWDEANDRVNSMYFPEGLEYEDGWPGEDYHFEMVDIYYAEKLEE